MKNVLITGSNSYIGTSLENWLRESPDKFTVHKISLRGNEWRDKDFSTYDTVIHVAGLVHKKETKENVKQYDTVNNYLTRDLAIKSKNENVKQFIFLSTMNVFGATHGEIFISTEKNPNTAYGISKLAAEEFLEEIKDENFKVAIIRPPMVYGSKCPGNYKLLSSIAKKVPVFPDFKNERSMIFIDNLSKYLEWCVDQEFDGILHPQNPTYICTSSMVKEIATNNKNSITTTKIFNGLIRVAVKFSTAFSKVFGSLTYAFEDKDIMNELDLIPFRETIKLSEDN